MHVNGTYPYLLIEYHLWNNFIQHSISIVRGFFPRNFFLNVAMRNFIHIFQHTITCSSNSEDERGFFDEEVKEDSIMQDYFSNSIFQEEDFQDVIDVYVVNNMIDSFDVSISSCCDESVVTNSYEYHVAHEKLFL
jgi:hypothetical protein